MKKLWNCKGRFKPVKVLILMLVLLFIFATLCFAYYRAKYTESAHGNNTTYGVNRSSISSFGYSLGNCAHCHEQHAMIGGAEPTPPPETGPKEFLLFAATNPLSQTDNFCFQCHTVGGSSLQVGGITNDDYGSTFGGGTTNSTNIKDAFNFGPPNQAATGNTGSSHNIEYVRRWTSNRPFGSWMTTDTNGCIACHDVHYAQKNQPVSGSGQPTGGVLTAVRRPSDVNSNFRNQWGDDNITFTETMAAFTATYQAPVFFPWVNGKMSFEPANNITSDGSNLPNFVDFCSVCHVSSIVSTRNDSYFSPDRNLNQVAYSGDEHGDVSAPNAGTEGALIYPYTNPAINYRLSCTDCHEPHGSPNPFLLRTCVNGKDGISVYIATVGFIGPPTDWDDLNFYDLCTACHTINVGVGNHSIIAPGQQTTFNCMSIGCHRHSPGAGM
jgi:predicted CXXCH cytochrome family protein